MRNNKSERRREVARLGCTLILKNCTFHLRIYLRIVTTALVQKFLRVHCTPDILVRAAGRDVRDTLHS